MILSHIVKVIQHLSSGDTPMSTLFFEICKKLPSSSVHTEGKSLLVTYDETEKELQISTLEGNRVDSIQCDALVAVMLSSDESLLLMLTKDGSVLALDLNEKGHTKSPMYNQSFSVKKTGGSTLALSNNKSLLVIGFGKQIQFFEIQVGKVVRPLQVIDLDSNVTSIRFADDDLGLRVITESAVVLVRNNAN